MASFPDGMVPVKVRGPNGERLVLALTDDQHAAVESGGAVVEVLPNLVKIGLVRAVTEALKENDPLTVDPFLAEAARWAPLFLAATHAGDGSASVKAFAMLIANGAIALGLLAAQGDAEDPQASDDLP